MTTQYERPKLTSTQKKLMWAFIIAVIGISLFMFQAVTYTVQLKETRDQTSPNSSEGSASEPTQVK